MQALPCLIACLRLILLDYLGSSYSVHVFMLCPQNCDAVTCGKYLILRFLSMLIAQERDDLFRNSVARLEFILGSSHLVFGDS